MKTYEICIHSTSTLFANTFPVYGKPFAISVNNQIEGKNGNKILNFQSLCEAVESLSHFFLLKSFQTFIIFQNPKPK